MVTKDTIKQVLASNQKDVENYKVTPRALPADDFPCHDVWKTADAFFR